MAVLDSLTSKTENGTCVFGELAVIRRLARLLLEPAWWLSGNETSAFSRQPFLLKHSPCIQLKRHVNAGKCLLSRLTRTCVISLRGNVLIDCWRISREGMSPCRIVSCFARHLQCCQARAISDNKLLFFFSILFHSYRSFFWLNFCLSLFSGVFRKICKIRWPIYWHLSYRKNGWAKLNSKSKFRGVLAKSFASHF